MTIKNREFLKPFRKYWFKILLAFLLAAIASGCSFVSVRLLAKFVDTISGNKNLAILINLILLRLLIELTGHVCSYVAAVCISKRKSDIYLETQMNFARRISAATIHSIVQFTPQDLTSRIKDDPLYIIDAVFNILREILNILLGIVSLFYVLQLSAEIFVLFVISLLLILIVQSKTIDRQSQSFDASHSASRGFEIVWQSILRSFMPIIVQHLEPGIKPEVSERMQKNVRAMQNAQLVVHKNTLLTSMLSLGSMTALLVLCSILVTNGKLSPVNFVEVFLYQGNIYALATVSLRIIRDLSLYKSAASRLSELVQTLKPRKYGNLRPIIFSGNISIKGVTAYRGNTKVFDDLSLDITDGEFIGIVGPSGCGKTTLLQLLAGALFDYIGQITLSNVPIDQLTKGSWRRLLCAAFQTPHWFDFFTVRHNLTLHCPDASDEQIWHALEKVCISDFIKEKGGLDSRIAQSEMSGGQLQRLALAIVVLSESKIILLDESTSALDGESQSIIVQAIRETTRRKEHTVLFIAHRISTLKNADRIIVMDEGKIVDIGNYAELLERCELFRKLALDG